MDTTLAIERLKVYQSSSQLGDEIHETIDARVVVIVLLPHAREKKLIVQLGRTGRGVVVTYVREGIHAKDAR